MSIPNKKERCGHHKVLHFTCALLFIGLPLLASATTPLATPNPADIEYPNDEAPSPREIALGRQLFFDTRLSLNKDISCATCHNPDLGFGDGLKKSTGANKQRLARHTPSLYNLAWNHVFFWDGVANTLEEQVLMPIAASAEMNLPIASLEQRLTANTWYKQEFSAIYAAPQIKEHHVAQALSAYVRTLTSTNSAFDQYLAGAKYAMSPSALRGLALFQGKAECHLCHDGANFSDESFHSLGIDDSDLGRGGVINEASLNHTFKTPGLRNITRSAPYMHDGSQVSLESVIRFYNNGGGPAGHKDKLIKKLYLTERDIADLIAFLGALNSDDIIIKPAPIK